MQQSTALFPRYKIIENLQEIYLNQPKARPNPEIYFPNIIPIEDYLAGRATPQQRYPQLCFQECWQEVEKLQEIMFGTVCHHLYRLLNSALRARVKDAQFHTMDSEDKSCVMPYIQIIVEPSTVCDWCALESQIKALLARSMAPSVLDVEVIFSLAGK